MLGVDLRDEALSPAGVAGWRLNPDARLLWRDWGGERLLCNAASGQTHLLNPLASQLLDLLAQGPLPLSAIQAALLAEPAAERDIGLLRRALDDLDQVGLIEPWSP